MREAHWDKQENYDLSFVSRLVRLCREITMQIIIPVMRKVSSKRTSNIPHTAVRVLFVKFKNMLGGYIPTMKDAKLEKHFSGNTLTMQKDRCKYLLLTFKLHPM